MLKPIKWNLVIYQGATFTAKRVWLTGADKDTAAPVDFTGCKGRMHIREELESEQFLLELTTENGYLQLGGSSFDDGSINLFLPPSITKVQEWEMGVHDIEIEWPDGYVRRLFAGSVRLSKEVTRE